MSAKLLLGKPCADSIWQSVQRQLDGRKCKLYTVGLDSAAWRQYCDSLSKSAQKVGVDFEEIFADDKVDPTAFCTIVSDTCRRKDATGVIVAQPLPKHLAHAVSFVDVGKDVDCLSPLSVAKLYKGEDGLYPATPLAVLRLLDYYGVDLQGKHVVIVGRGNAVGKPLALLALQRNATVTVCHSKTVNLAAICKSADVLISACGVAGLITKDFVNPNSIVVDVGLSFVDGKTCGDVATEVQQIAAAVSPVPGGVGPVTRATLFENLCKAGSHTK